MSFISAELPELPEIGAMAELMPGFEFDRLIARDGTGAVYKACHRLLGRDVAIKVLPCELGKDPHFRRSFQANAKSMARLAHPNLIRVYDSGDMNGHLFTVMEYVPGKSLFRCAHGTAIEPKQSVEIVISACQGLIHAHENGVVHGDIRPANILLTTKCEPKIGNFEMPRGVQSEVAGRVMEGAEYMAPELVNQSDKVSPGADVFALGVILRELLTGIPAASGDAAKHVVSDPGLDAICRKATHPDPRSRFPDAASLSLHLTNWMDTVTSGKVVRSRQLAFNPPPSTAHRPTLVVQRPPLAGSRPSLAGFDRGHSQTGRPLGKYCAILALTICAAYLALGVYPAEIQAATREQSGREEKSAIHPAVAKPGAGGRSTVSRELAVASRGDAK